MRPSARMSGIGSILLPRNGGSTPPLRDIHCRHLRRFDYTSLAMLAGTIGGEAAGGAAVGAGGDTRRRSFRPRKLCKAAGVGRIEAEMSGGVLTAGLRVGAPTTTDVTRGDELTTTLLEGM